MTHSTFPRRLTRAFALCLSASIGCSGLTALSAPIQNLVFTEVIKEVFILDAATKTQRPAKVGDNLTPPNILQTGPESRAELIAEDKTVTRVGSNTVFSVDPGSRDVNIGKGSVLFHSPSGKGGGTIKCAGATASVLGTTLIVGANQEAGFKVMLLEGKGQVKAPNSQSVKLSEGQLSFAMPGQKPSAPLNFELKGQVASSKLVGGFSKPVASIDKINAAVAKQQAKIANGSLEKTQLAIGDRPDTAFKLDSTTITVIHKIVQEEAVKQETASRSKPDERYLRAIASLLKIGDTTAPGENIFAIDGSGVNTSNGYGLPKLLPGDQAQQGTHSALFAQNLSFESGTDSYFLTLPVNVPKGTDHAALLALQDLRFARSIEFVGLSSYTDEVIEVIDLNGQKSTQSASYWKPLHQLLLSAGRTLSINPGSFLQADVPLWDIFTQGVGYSPDLNLSKLDATGSSGRTGLTWEAISLSNRYVAPDSGTAEPFTGKIRITAPSMTLNRVQIDAGSVELRSEDALSINNTASVSSTALPLGFESADDLAIYAADTVKLTSTKKAVTLTGVHFIANSVQIDAETELKMDRVTMIPYDMTPAAPSFSATVRSGKLTILDSDLAPAGQLSAQAASALLTTNPKWNLALEATTSDLEINQAPPAVASTVEYRTVITAQAVSLTSGNNLKATSLAVRSSNASASVTAKAANELNFNKVDLSEAQSVALAATTVVLADTNFKDGSTVTLAVRDAKVAADPGTGQTVSNGKVNFVRNVFYGPTEIKFTSGTDMTHDQFQAKADQNLGAGKLKNITISSLPK